MFRPQEHIKLVKSEMRANEQLRNILKKHKEDLVLGRFNIESAYPKANLPGRKSLAGRLKYNFVVHLRKLRNRDLRELFEKVGDLKKMNKIARKKLVPLIKKEGKEYLRSRKEKIKTQNFKQALDEIENIKKENKKAVEDKIKELEERNKYLNQYLSHLTSISITSSGGASFEDVLGNLKNKNKQLLRELEKHKSKVDSLKEALNAAEADARSAKKEREKLLKEREKLNKQILQHQKRVEELAHQLNVLLKLAPQKELKKRIINKELLPLLKNIEKAKAKPPKRKK